MELSEFIKILDSKLYAKLTYNSGNRSMPQGARMKAVLDLFVLDDNDETDFIFDNDYSDQYLGSIYSGKEKMPRAMASHYLGHLSYDTFEYNTSDYLSEDSFDSIISDFKDQGVQIRKDHIFQDITVALQEILEPIALVKKKDSIRYAEFYEDHVKIGTSIIQIPKELAPPSTPAMKEKPFINALLEVYAENENIDNITLEDLSKYDPIYTKEIKIARESFYKAELVLRKVRDVFSDGVKEFENLKQETFDGIEDDLIYPVKGLEKYRNVMYHVTVLNYSKSYLGRDNNGLIGPKEKKGIIHMLVNDKKIRWID